MLDMLMPFECTWMNAAAIYTGLIAAAYVWRLISAPGFNVRNKHVFITGGSTGLGLALARKCVCAGANVTIVSRKQHNLDAAIAELEKLKLFESQKLLSIATDVVEYTSVCEAIASSESFHGGPVDHLICCAGMCSPGIFLDQDVSMFEREMNINYFGVLYTIKAALPTMIQKASSKRHITIVSSGAAFTPFIGYAAYCSSKCAVRALSDVLRNELQLYDIGVSIYFPANMDTPGLEAENRSKPQPTKVIEGSASTVSADDAADSFVNSFKKGIYGITNDPLMELSRYGANGIVPRSNVFLELLLQPIVFVVQFGFMVYMDYVVGVSKKKANLSDNKKNE